MFIKKIMSFVLACALLLSLAACGAKPVNEPKTDTTAAETVSAETDAVEMTTGETASEPSDADRKVWQEKAYAAMRSAKFPVEGEVYSLSFVLMDLTGDGIPEIIETMRFYEGIGGPYAILAWEDGEYAEAYRFDPEGDVYVGSIEAYRNKETGQIELWDLGEIDYELQDYYPDEETDSSPVFPAIGAINENIDRLEIRNGKLVVAESHDEIQKFATYGLTDDQVERAWNALHDFSTAFWKTHDREPVALRHVEIEFLPFSSYSSVEEIQAEREADFYSDLEKDYDADVYIYDREQLRKIIEEY